MKNTALKNESSVLLSKNTSAKTQRKQIITLLERCQSVSTPEFRRFGIMAPAPRIFELRNMGFPIEKVLESYVDETGKRHSGVARYYLANNPPASGAKLEAAA